jgi:hypothetical protein
MGFCIRRRFMMSDSRLIRSENFPDVTVDHIRALMQRLVAYYPRGWESNNGERLIGFGEERQLTGPDRTVDVTPATRGSWAVGLHPGSPGLIKCWAGIEAYEQPGHTKVDFWDGYFPGAPPGVEYPPIGAAFEEFCEMVIGEVQAASGKQAELQVHGGAVAEQLTPAEDKVGKKHGPTVKTQIRAKVFKQLKDEHPEWSQTKVAIEACDKLGEYVTADTVRNAYRAMGWEWKRADRIR